MALSKKQLSLANNYVENAFSPDEQELFFSEFERLDARQQEGVLRNILTRVQEVPVNVPELDTSNDFVKIVAPVDLVSENQMPNALSQVIKGLDVASFGLPGRALQKRNPALHEQIFQPAENNVNQAINIGSQIVGLMFGGAGNISSKLAGKAFPRATQGLSAVPDTIRNFKSAQAITNIKSGALQGGLFGALQTAGETGDPLATATATATGAGIGAGAGSLLGTQGRPGALKRLHQAYKKSKVTAQRPATKRLGELKSEVKSVAQQQGSAISKEISQKSKATKAEISRLQQQSKAEVSEISGYIDDNINALREQLTADAGKSTKVVQKGLGDFSRNISTAYGETLDDIATVVASSGDDILISQTDDLLTKTIDEVRELGITPTKLAKATEKLSKKYGRKFVSGQQGVKSKFGTRATRSNENDVVDVKEFIKDTKKVMKDLSAQVKSTGRGTEEDISLMILRKNYGQLLDEASGGQYSNLQESYGKAAEGLKQAYRTFQPKKGDIGGSAGIKKLEKVAKGKALKPEEDFVRFLEEGTTIGTRKVQGVGNITKSLKQTSKEIERLQQSKGTLNTQAQATVDAKVRELQNKMVREIQDLALKQDEIANGAANTAARIEARKRIAEDIAANAKKMNQQTMNKIIRNLPERAMEAVSIYLVFKVLGAFEGER